MGYRFSLRRLEYPALAKPVTSIPISMWWLNAGVAPIYKEYWLAVELQSVEKTTVLRIPADLTRWLAGDAVVDKSLFIPQDLPPGTYRFRVALLDPKTSQPAVLLAIKGRQPYGWYDLGSVELKP